jgi:hypothetical protein
MSIRESTAIKLVEHCTRILAQKGRVPFSRKDLIACIQERRPGLSKNTINPIIQAVTENLVGGVPAYADLKILRSVGRGLFEPHPETFPDLVATANSQASSARSGKPAFTSGGEAPTDALHARQSIVSLVEDCARHLQAKGFVPFSRQQLIECIRRIRPNAAPASIHPVIQAVTDGLEGGAPVYESRKILIRVARGLFVLHPRLEGVPDPESGEIPRKPATPPPPDPDTDIVEALARCAARLSARAQLPLTPDKLLACLRKSHPSLTPGQLETLIDTVTDNLNREPGTGPTRNILRRVAWKKYIPAPNAGHADAKSGASSESPPPPGSKGRPNFATVWRRIKNHQGEVFHTLRGILFTYEIDANGYLTTRKSPPGKGFTSPREDFRNAYDFVPLPGPAHLQAVVASPSYVWAILHDERIRGNDW